MKKPDVVVVGAGVMGCATAYWLSKAGCTVTVIEQEGLAHGASGMSPAMIGPVVEGTPEDARMAELARTSLELHDELSRSLPEESNVDIGYRRNPTVHLAFSDADVQSLKRQADVLVQQGESVQWVEGQRLTEVEPRVNSESVGGLVSEQAQVLAYRFVLGLTVAAERHGMSLRQGEVVGLESRAGRVTGVRLRSGATISTGTVVLAMGAWSQIAASWLGMKIPISPVRGQLVKLDVDDPQLKSSLSYNGMYVLYKADGDTLAGTTEEADSGFVNHPTRDGLYEIMEAAVRLAPSLEEARIKSQVSGLRPASEDDLPLIGPVRGWEGVYIVSGHFRDGIKLSTMSTRVVADLVLTGRTTVSIDRFDPSRFGKMEE